MKQNWKLRFYVIWAGQAFSVLSSSVLQMALIWHLTAVTQSAAVLSVASLAAFLPTALLGGPAGALVDRWNRKRVIICADLAIALVSLALAAYAAYRALPCSFIVAALFLRSIGTAFHTPAISAITPLIVPEDMLTKCAGMTQSVQTLGYMAGTAIAGALYPVWSLSGMVLLDVIGAVIASFAVALVAIPEPPKAEAGAMQKTDMWMEMRQGYRLLRQDRGLFSLLWIGAAFMVLFAPIGALYPLMSLDYFHGTTVQASIVEIAFAAGMLLGGVLLGAWGGFFNRTLNILCAFFIVAVTLVLCGLLPTTGFVYFVALCALMGLSGPLYNGTQTALMQERIEPQYLGRVFGLYGSISSLAMPVGLVFSGLFADGVGVNRWFLLSGIGCGVIGVVAALLPGIRNIDEHRGA